MAEKRIVTEFGNDYDCTEFYCTDRNVGGVSVTRLGSEEIIGEVIGVSLPDPSDDDEVAKFNNTVIQWVVDNEAY